MTVSSLFSPHTPSSARINATLERAKVWRDALIGDDPTNRRLYFTDQPWTIDLDQATAMGRADLHSGIPIPVLSRLFASVIIKTQVSALDRRCRELHHRAHLASDEHGQWTLRHVHGLMTLAGKGEDQAAITAPIFIQPVRLDPVGAPVRDWMIESYGPWDVNRELLFRLARDWKVEPDPNDVLKAFLTDGFEAGIAVLMAGFAASSIWSVADRQVIDLLAPSPLAPVVELERLMTRLPKLPLIAAIAGSREAQEEVVAKARVSMPLDLPDRLTLDEDVLVLDADAAQHQAVNMALSGASLVVQGPPGTGKTQTIANMAAALAGRGQRVLITSAKAVALDHLVARLDQAGLGDLVADVREVRETGQLVEALHDQLIALANNPPGGGDYQAKGEAVWPNLRADLAQWVEVMHEPRKDWGVSYFEAQHQRLMLPDAPQVPGWTLSRDGLERLDAQGRDDTLAALGAWADLRVRVDATKVPWQVDQVADAAIVEEILAIIDKIKDEWLPQSNSYRRTVSAANTLTRIPSITRWGEVLELIAAMIEMEGILGDQAFSPELDELFSVYTAKRDKTFRVLDRDFRAATKTLKAMVADKDLGGLSLDELAAKALDLRAQWSALAHTREPQEVRDLEAQRGIHAQLQEALTWLSGLLEETDLGALTHEQVAEMIEAMAASREVIATLPQLAVLDDQIRLAHVYPIVDAVRLSDLEASQVKAAFDAEWLRALIHVVTSEDQTLWSFVGEEANSRLRAWQASDRDHVAATGRRIADQVHERAHQTLRFRREEAQAIRALVQSLEGKPTWRNRRRLQRLWGQAPEVLPAMRPIWVMGPDDVAEVLPPDAVFDVVIVDEASLLKPERAVGSLSRARRMIVVGDDHQLTPVTRRWTTDVDHLPQEEVSHDHLFGIASTFLPVVTLGWNHRVEDGRLIDPVSAVYPTGYYGLPGTKVPSPIQVMLDVSGVIERVVDEMVHHARTQPELSLGVVCPTISMAVRIQSVLAQRLTTVDGIPAAPFFTQADDESVFIKPVDAVQGEERDVVIMAITQNTCNRFLGDQGVRRAVVGSTRARKAMNVISDMTEETTRQLAGVKDAGAQVIARLLRGDQATHDQYMEETYRPLFNAIAASLEAAGMPVALGVGRPPIGVRLAVCHPEQRDRLVLAIGVDGVLYRDFPTVRDRERLHRDGLVERGWAVHRLWLHEWFMNPDVAVEQVRNAWEEAVRVIDAQDREARARREAQAGALEATRVEQEAEARALAASQQKVRQAALATPAPALVPVVEEEVATDPPSTDGDSVHDDGTAGEAQPVATDPHGEEPDATPKPVSTGTETTTEAIALQPAREDGCPNLPKGLKIERHSAHDLAALAGWVITTNPGIDDGAIMAEMMKILGYTRKGKRIASRFERAIRTARKDA